MSRRPRRSTNAIPPEALSVLRGEDECPAGGNPFTHLAYIPLRGDSVVRPRPDQPSLKECHDALTEAEREAEGIPSTWTQRFADDAEIRRRWAAARVEQRRAWVESRLAWLRASSAG